MKFVKFHNVTEKESPKKQGVYLAKKGYKQQPGPLGPSRFFLQKAVSSRGSNLARLGELGGKLLPYFAINRGRSEEGRGSAFLALRIHLKLVRKIVSVGDFTKIFNRSSPFFVALRSSTGKFPKWNFSVHSMYPQWSSFVFISFTFRTPFWRALVIYLSHFLA